MILLIASIIIVVIFIGTNALYNQGGEWVRLYFVTTSALFVINTIAKALIRWGEHLQGKPKRKNDE